MSAGVVGQPLGSPCLCQDGEIDVLIGWPLRLGGLCESILQVVLCKVRGLRRTVSVAEPCLHVKSSVASWWRFWQTKEAKGKDA
eukprot:6056022-Amphidinium_carterae.1